MFRFVNTQGRRIWIRLGTVLAIFENEEKDGTFTLQCTGSCWTMHEKDALRLVDRLNEYFRDEEDEDPDWWKHGRSNPLDREEDE